MFFSLCSIPVKPGHWLCVYQSSACRPWSHSKAAKTLSRSSGEIYLLGSRIRCYGGVFLDDTRTADYYTHVHEATPELDIDYRHLIAGAPVPFKTIAETSARIRVLNTLQIDEKSAVIDRMLDPLREHGVDPGGRFLPALDVHHDERADRRRRSEP